MTSQSPSYRGYRFPREIISHAVWLYNCFFLSFRDVEDLLAQRGVTVSYETIRHWCQTFGIAYARTLRRRRGRRGDTWYLDEIFVTMHGRRQYLWRAVDRHPGPVAPRPPSRRALRSHGVKRTRPIASPSCHGQAAQLLGSPPYRHADRGAQHSAVREQPSGGLASTDAATPAPNAPVQRKTAAARLAEGWVWLLSRRPPEMRFWGAREAVVFCVDEKSGIQALDRTCPVLPLRPGVPERQTHDYVRHGTTTLYAALRVLDGVVIGECRRRHRSQEFIQFLRRLERATPPDQALHLILDNLSAHKSPHVRRWLTRHPRVHFHFVPTSSSWLNLVERWFAEITRTRLRRGTF